MSDTIFSDLKARILEAEQDPSVDTAHAAVELLRDWLASHETTIVERKIAEPKELNGTKMQRFHCYVEADGQHWRRPKQEAPALSAAGLTAPGPPPANKGGRCDDVGHGVYSIQI